MDRFRTYAVLGLCAGLSGFFGAVPAFATLIASDNFDSYSVGVLGSNNGGVGWTGAWTGSSGASVAATTGGDSPMTGNAAQFKAPNASSAATRSLSSQSDNILVNFDFQFDAGTISNNDFLGLWFGSSAGPNIGLKANCGNGSCTADIFARTVGVGGVFSTDISFGTTFSIMGFLSKTGTFGNNYDRFDLWVNPTGDHTSTPDQTYLGNSLMSTFSTIGFRTVNLGSTDALLVDNLSLTLIPEPGSLALLGLGLLGLGFSRRKRA